MNREALLAGGAALIAVGSLLVVAVVPGALASPDRDVRPGFVSIEEMTVAHGPVSGQTATLTVDTHVSHRGATTENVSVLLRATDLETGLVATTRTLDVGTVEATREVSVTGNLSVEREGGYRLETVLYRDGERVDAGRADVRGVGTLEPAYARSTVEFHRFERADLPVVEFSVAEVDGNRTRLNVSAHLTNTGDDPESGLRLVLKARQADSNILADETTVPVGEVAPGRTATPGTALVVPEGYNYYLDAVLWKDGVIVGTERAPANLDPTETLRTNETQRDVGLEVSDFERDRDGGGAGDRPTGTPAGVEQPGFGFAIAVAALLAVAAVLGRRSR